MLYGRNTVTSSEMVLPLTCASLRVTSTVQTGIATNFMGQSPSCEDNNRSASKKFPDFMDPEGSLPCSQEPATGPYPKPDGSSPHLSTLFP